MFVFQGVHFTDLGVLERCECSVCITEIRSLCFYLLFV